MHFFNLPNFISLARLLSVPVLINLILSHEMVASFWVFLAASLSDALDGYLARKLKVRTELGSFLDPIADKALLISIYLDNTSLFNSVFRYWSCISSFFSCNKSSI